MARAGELGADQALTFLREIDSINMRQRGRMVELTRQELGGGPFLGKRVAVLGATFKPDSDDVRDSPALNVAGQIHLQGGQVTVYDPKGMDNARRVFPTLGYADSALEAVRGAHVVLHLTEWREFRELDPAELGEVAAERVVLDGRNALDAEAWRRAAGASGRWDAPAPEARLSRAGDAGSAEAQSAEPASCRILPQPARACRNYPRFARYRRIFARAPHTCMEHQRPRPPGLRS